MGVGVEPADVKGESSSSLTSERGSLLDILKIKERKKGEDEDRS